VVKELGNTRPDVKGAPAGVTPQGRIFVFFRAEGPDLPPYAEQLASFKAEKGLGPHDTLVEVTLTFDA
jgi:hypothetical protein